MAKTVWTGSQKVNIPAGMHFTLWASMDREGSASVSGAGTTVTVTVPAGKGSDSVAGTGTGEMVCSWDAWNASGAGHCNVEILLADGTVIPVNTGGGGTETTAPADLPETQVNLSFPATGGSQSLGQVLHSMSEREVIESISDEWLSITARIICVAAHGEKTSRAGTVVIRHESLVTRDGVSTWEAQSRTVYNITQRGIFYITPETLTFPPQGATQSVTFHNEVPASITPANGDLLWGKFALGGSAQVFCYPLCVHGLTAAAQLTETITYTDADGQTATLTVIMEPPTRTTREFSASPKLFNPPPGTLTVSALYPENDTVHLITPSISSLPHFLTLASKTESPGSTVWVFDVAHPGHVISPPSTGWSQGIALAALFIPMPSDCTHTDIYNDYALMKEGITSDDTDPGGGDDSGSEDGEEETPQPVAGTLALAAEPEHFSCEGGTLTLTATFNEAVAPENIALFIPEEAREWIAAAGEATASETTKTWTLRIAANNTGTPRTAPLAVFAETLAASAKITQGAKPERLPAFFREKHFFNFGIF